MALQAFALFTVAKSRIFISRSSIQLFITGVAVSSDIGFGDAKAFGHLRPGFRFAMQYIEDLLLCNPRRLASARRVALAFIIPLRCIQGIGRQWYPPDSYLTETIIRR